MAANTKMAAFLDITPFSLGEEVRIASIIRAMKEDFIGRVPRYKHGKMKRDKTTDYLLRTAQSLPPL
jgi:hypothetical protein